MEVPATLKDKQRIENEMSWEDRGAAATVYRFISERSQESGSRDAVTFQLLSNPSSKSETLTWSELHAKVTQTANLFRSLGVGEEDTVAFLLPNCHETVFTLLGGAVAGIVNPINPLLDAEQVAGILRASNAKVLVTLKAFPKTDVPQLAARAVAMVPSLEHVLEVDLCRYLTPPKSWIVPLIRPKNPVTHAAQVSDFHAMLQQHRSDQLDFEDSVGDRVAALFHTGGTTGIPKLARHCYSGIIFNGWAGGIIGLESGDTVLCPLPLFHVFAAYPALMSAIASGSHLVFPTPAGYRGDGVFDNFWKLVERWKVTYFLTVPTALAALMQRPINADISTLKTALSGSAPLPMELYRRFEDAVGVPILEGYGLTEATCLVSVNPLTGERKVGSVGLPVPYVQTRILNCSSDGAVAGECGTGEIGEICISSPGVLPGRTYIDPSKNQGLYAEEKWLRTGDLGKIDEDGYLWITGRAKDLIIRGGHNIDPAWIEEPLAGHEAVAFAGAVGQPDARLGEMPCVYVELVAGGAVSSEDLMAFAEEHIDNRLAVPGHIEILDELPKTAVGKVFKPDLRKRAIQRVFDQQFSAAGIDAKVVTVREDPQHGLTAEITLAGESDHNRVTELLSDYTIRWKVIQDTEV
ncbi:MAG: acyl-CoA synthetase [Rhodobacteraceae bacterium]|nr:acyl-CoA synthetase [Paracoccaceae bacterium]